MRTTTTASAPTGFSPAAHNLPVSTSETGLNLNPSFDWPSRRGLANPAHRPRRRRPRLALSDARWLRAQELWQVGRTGQGDGEVFDLIEAYTSDPIAMYTLSRELQSRRTGRHVGAGRSAPDAYAQHKPESGLPKALLSLSYPPAFGQSAQRYAHGRGHLAAADARLRPAGELLRPASESPAGALGLTQVLPSTGRAIATKLGVPGCIGRVLFPGRSESEAGRSLHGRSAC